MSFRTYFLGLDVAQRTAYADRVGSSVGYLTQVAYGNKKVELGFADVLIAVAVGQLTLGDLPLTDRALEQHERRNPPKSVDGAAPPPAAEPAATTTQV